MIIRLNITRTVPCIDEKLCGGLREVILIPVDSLPILYIIDGSYKLAPDSWLASKSISTTPYANAAWNSAEIDSIDSCLTM